MLRTIKTPMVGAKLLGVSGTTAASATNTVQVGEEEAAFTNADNDQELDMALVVPFSRAPIVVTTPGNGIGDGGAAYLTANPSASEVSVTTENGAGTGDVGSQHSLILGFTNEDDQAAGGRLGFGQRLRGSRKQPRVIYGEVDSTGIQIGASNQYSITDNGTGDHTLTFDRPFNSIPVCVAIPVTGTAGASCRIESISRSSVNILTFNAANSATDLDFMFIVLGWDTEDSHRLEKGPSVKCEGLAPRLLAGRIDWSAGTPSMAIGSELFGTLTDNGLGDVTVPFAEKFARRPVIVASAAGGTDNWVTVNTADVSSCQLEITDSAGSNGDPASVHLIVLGFDDATPY